MTKLFTASLFALFLSLTGLSAQPYSFAASWIFDGSVNTGSSSVTTANAQPAVFGSGINNIQFSNDDNAGEAYQGQNWPTVASLNLDDYFQVNLTTDPGTTFVDGVNISISFQERRSNTGPLEFEIRASTDNFGTYTTIGTETLPDDNNWRDQGPYTYTISGSPTALAFRIYGYSSEANGGTWRFDDVQISGTSALPITLQNFSARPIGIHTVQLEWSSAQERNSQEYVIERSADSRSFEAIGQTPAAGNSDAVQTYRFNDEKALQGRAYYRLRMRDLDGKETFSPVQSVRLGSSNGALVYPFQVTENLHVQLDQAFAQEGNWQVFNLQGQSIASGTLPAEQQTFSFDAAAWPKGAYVLHLFADGNQISKLFEKN